jgi:hypothetical protein
MGLMGGLELWLSCGKQTLFSHGPLTVDVTITLQRAGEEGLLTLAVAGMPAVTYRIEPRTRLLVSGHGVRLTLLE